MLTGTVVSPEPVSDEAALDEVAALGELAALAAAAVAAAWAFASADELMADWSTEAKTLARRTASAGVLAYAVRRTSVAVFRLMGVVLAVVCLRDVTPGGTMVTVKYL